MSTFTDATTDELLAALPSLSVPKACSALADARVLIVGGSIGGLAAAACLQAAGFTNVRVLERSAGDQKGAGIGIDDVSAAILKGLGVFGCTTKAVAVQRMRWTEDRLSCGKTLLRQPLPYFSSLYSELQRGLLAKLLPGSVTFGSKATRVEHMPQGGLRVHFAEGSEIECDVLIAADGPRSAFRGEVVSGSEDLRYAGYAAWRGTLHEADLPASTRDAFRGAYPHFGNCLYFVLADKPRQHAVVYDIGGGQINWLIYENRTHPVAEPGRTTSAATEKDIARLRDDACKHWGEAFGEVIKATPEPFWTDVYDIETPLPTFAANGLVLLGDSAHPMTPHMAKGSNLAMHDAYSLACASASASGLAEMLDIYSASRAPECARTLLFSRHLGRLRNGLLGGALERAPPQNEIEFLQAVKSAGLGTSTLPAGEEFQAIWHFAEDGLSSTQRGFFLERDTAGKNTPAKRPRLNSLCTTALNHISRETEDVERLARFYTEVLGLPRIFRPNFGFGGAWLQLPGNMQFHIIERDPDKPGETLQDAALSNGGHIPERFIRRSHHIALAVPDIEAAKQCLSTHGISFAVNAVPGTSIVQLFLYDPDGNGVEVGNFDSK